MAIKCVNTNATQNIWVKNRRVNKVHWPSEQSSLYNIVNKIVNIIFI